MGESVCRKFVRIFCGLHVSEACECETTVENLLVVGDEKTAFTGGHAFVLIEGEGRAVTERSRLLAFVEGVVGLCGIFYDFEIVFFGDFTDGIHITAETVEVDAKDGFGPWRDSGFDLGGIHEECFWIDIDEDRHGHVVDDARGTGRPCVGGDDNLVARADTAACDTHLEGGATAIREIGVFVSVESAELLFEHGCVFTAALRRFMECRDDEIFVCFINGWPIFDFSHLDDWFTAFDCKL